MRGNRVKFLIMLALLILAFSALPVGAQGGGEFTLTVLHNNDGESKLLNAGGEVQDFGGVARFASLVNRLRTEAVDGSGNTGVVLLSSGDNFLAGPEFDASLEKGAPFYDTTAIKLIGYDAMAIGNHEFDFGPDVLADFITGFEGSLPFVSANLDFSGEPRLQALMDQGSIVKSLVINEEGQQIGVVGATTPRIPFISSPRNVRANPDVAGAIQAEINAMEASGVNKIIVISHLQDANEDLALAGQLSGVDIMIAGGGDELLADEDTLLVPGDVEPFGPYPLTATGADGASIPVVTTAGDYKYVGRLVVTFDGEGKVTAVDPSSGLVRVAGGDNPDAVEPDPALQAEVVTPVQTFVEGLANNVIGASEVGLDGRRDPGVRTQETNLGSLMADALLWQANQLVGNFGASPANVGLQNGGGIRNNNVIPAGQITELNTFSVAPFSNFVSIVPNISPEQFKEIMENAVSAVETADGRFAQIAGFTMTYDLAGTPQVLDENSNVTTPGTRVREIKLDDGTMIVQDGAVVAGAPALNIATIDFSARGGDQYPFREAPFTPLGVSYQQALSNYITEALGGVISTAQYPEGGSGRITQIGAAAAPAVEGAPAPESAPATTGACAQDYVIQTGDTLGAIASNLLGSSGAFTAIVEATNAAAATDNRYATIDNPNLISVGQTLCIPGPAGSSAAPASGDGAAAPATDGAAATTDQASTTIPEGKGVLVFENLSSVDLIFDIIGPTPSTLLVPPGAKQNFILEPGQYQYNAHQPGGGFKVAPGAFAVVAGQAEGLACSDASVCQVVQVAEPQ